MTSMLKAIKAWLVRANELDRLYEAGLLRDPEKAERARILARLDRQMTSDEWKEFGELVRDGF